MAKPETLRPTHDIDDGLAQLMDSRGRCNAQIERRGTLWTCVRPEGHEGHHAAVDITLRYFDGEGAEGKPSGRVSFRSRLLPRERD